MKYTSEIEIDLPVSKVVELFDSVENMYDWMEGLQSFEPLEGTPGEVGAKSRLVFKNGNRTIEMVETITVKDLPGEFSGTYEANGVWNLVSNHFDALDENRTRYISHQEFQFKGFMKLMALLMPGAFKKQTLKHLQAFKKFAEGQAAS